MKTIFAKQALLATGWATNVRLQVAADGRIADVTANTAPQAQDQHLGEGVLLPALSNLHSHAFQRAMAGMTEYRHAAQGDSFWTWRELMYRFLQVLGPEHIEAIAALVYMEMLEAGYIAVAEFHYLHHQLGGEPYDHLAETSERIFAAAQQTGIGLTHLPVLYSHGGAGEQALNQNQLRFGNDLDRFCQLIEQARAQMAATLPQDCRIGVAPHSLRATSIAQLQQLVAMHQNDPIHIHIAEQQAEVDAIQQRFGQRPVACLLDRVDVNSHWCLVHATHMDTQETAALAQSGAVAGLCPITEANLGDGIFNGAAFLQAGGHFGIGSDSNVRIALAEELRLLEYSQRLREQSRNVMLLDTGSVGASLYQAALKGGAQALGRDSSGIKVGTWADLLALDGSALVLAGVDFEQSPDTLFDAWLFAGDDSVVRDVWSAGRHMVQNGRHIAREAITQRYCTVIKQLLSSDC